MFYSRYRRFNIGAKRITNIFWLQNPGILIVCGTSNGPQEDIGNYLGPCTMGFTDMASYPKMGAHGVGLGTRSADTYVSVTYP